MDKMKLEDAINILTEMQKWRRAQPPYDGDTPFTIRKMPYSAETFGLAIDFAISSMKGMQQQLSQKRQDERLYQKVGYGF